MSKMEGPRTALHVRIEHIGRFAVAGRWFSPSVTQGFIELYVEGACAPEILLSAASTFAVERGGAATRVRDTWHVPMVRVVIPTPSETASLGGCWEVADSLFQSLHRLLP